MIVIDTNAFIRFFTNDIPSDAEKVQRLIATEKEIFVPEVVFGEIDYVLSSVYKSSKKEVEDVYEFIESNSQFKFKKHINDAIYIFKNNNIGMYDSLIAAQSQGKKLASFDKKVLKVSGVERY